MERPFCVGLFGVRSQCVPATGEYLDAARTCRTKASILTETIKATVDRERTSCNGESKPMYVPVNVVNHMKITLRSKLGRRLASLRGPLCAGEAFPSGGSCGGRGAQPRDVGPRSFTPLRCVLSTPHIAATPLIMLLACGQAGSYT